MRIQYYSNAKYLGHTSESIENTVNDAVQPSATEDNNIISSSMQQLFFQPWLTDLPVSLLKQVSLVDQHYPKLLCTSMFQFWIQIIICTLWAVKRPDFVNSIYSLFVCNGTNDSSKYHTGSKSSDKENLNCVCIHAIVFIQGVDIWTL